MTVLIISTKNNKTQLHLVNEPIDARYVEDDSILYITASFISDFKHVSFISDDSVLTITGGT